MSGEIVRVHRRRLGLTQEELADKTGLSVRSIGNLEAGRIVAPRPATVRLLADAFGLAGADRDRFCHAVSRPVDRPNQTVVPAQLPIDVQGFTGGFYPRSRMEGGGAGVVSHAAGQPHGAEGTTGG
jgi:transcriptional regulator with XRE-family HTH domain